MGRLGSVPCLVGRIWSGIRVSASFHKIARFVGRLGSVPRLVGRLKSGIRVSASFHKNCPPRGSVRVSTPHVGRVWSGILVSASFHKNCPPRGLATVSTPHVGRVWSWIRISASFHKKLLTSFNIIVQYCTTRILRKWNWDFTLYINSHWWCCVLYVLGGGRLTGEGGTNDLGGRWPGGRLTGAGARGALDRENMIYLQQRLTYVCLVDCRSRETGCLKKVSPLKLFGIFPLWLSLFAWNFANLLAIHIHTHLSIFGRFILIFHQMASIFPRVIIVFTLSSFDY